MLASLQGLAKDIDNWWRHTHAHIHTLWLWWLHFLLTTLFNFIHISTDEKPSSSLSVKPVRLLQDSSVTYPKTSMDIPILIHEAWLSGESMGFSRLWIRLVDFVDTLHPKCLLSLLLWRCSTKGNETWATAGWQVSCEKRWRCKYPV